MMKRHRQLWILYALLSALAAVVLPQLPGPYSDPSMLTGTIAAIWAVAFFQRSRHAEDAKFLKELMESFNKRYNRMNEKLQSAIKRDGEFNQEQQLDFIDYFNLCAEEWLFWEKGYIDEQVWRAWENGMRQYSADPRVLALWETENRTGSYYGFQMPLV